ncbi:uncharacterized protein FIESC28_03453 [Fusarium coffeatum]|uniref:Ig-like domain-containing protein n=1 Tax=Fusarium coffeatum TaxID=231269 RepID=A0A366S4E5_9HYPO|nr:uncharacterized protein FIESC28_03453 [Fusarium coffeatum]RBR23748.1 hypothetical protein FIESC28_03453 [Fusarium coffeatum]
MRCGFFLLGVGFYAADSVIASPCKPNTSTSEAATITSDSTAEATRTILELSSIAWSEPTTTVELTATTATSEDGTTTIAAAEYTTTLIETSAATTSDAATTSEAPAGEPTFVLGASGGSLNGAQPQGTGQQGTFIAFDATAISGSSPRKFTVDSTGRLQDAETAAYVCAYYWSSPSAAYPPYVSYCGAGPVGGSQWQEYLTCQVNNGNLACTAPRVFCSTDANDESTCPRAGGDPYDTFFTDSGKFWFIGSGSPANMSPVSVSARKQR